MDSVEPTTLRVQIGDNWYTVEVSDITDFPIQVLVDGEPVVVSADKEKLTFSRKPATEKAVAGD